MKKVWTAVSVLLAVLSLGCHKSESPAAVISGVYTENSPVTGGSILNFASAGTVIVSGKSFFLEQLSAPDTLRYSLSAGSGGSLISFVTIESGVKDTLTCNYAILSNGELELSFAPCPPGVPCYALGGTSFLYKK